MAIDLTVPVALPQSAADYITAYGTATLYLEYGTATTPADGTATTTLVSGTEKYEFVLTGVDVDYYYRWRVGDGSTYTAYAPVFQMPVAYATVQEFIRGRDFPDESREDEILSLLIDASDYITRYVCGGRSFYRDPVGSGTTTKTLDIRWPNQSKLSLARGRDLDIISVTSLKVREYTGDTQVTVASGSTGYYLLPDDPLSGYPYTDIQLSDQGDDFVVYPTGLRIVEIVGAFGWSAIPDLVRRATVDLARHWYENRTSSEPVGMSAFGQPVFGPGTPKTVRDLARSQYAWHGWTG